MLSRSRRGHDHAQDGSERDPPRNAVSPEESVGGYQGAKRIVLTMGFEGGHGGIALARQSADQVFGAFHEGT